MKLKDDLVLRKVADQYVIVPVGKRIQEVTSIVYISSSAAYLWDFMKDNEFSIEDLVNRIIEHYIGVTVEQATVDVNRFIKVLEENSILDDGVIRGSSVINVSKKMLDKLWPKDALYKKNGDDTSE